jgi:glycosyltransferase involved in cell wall biosynthesis
MYRRDLAAIRESAPDVVLSRHEAYCLSMTLASRRAGVPFVVYADAPVAYEKRLYDKVRWHPPGLPERIERLSLRGCRAVVATSHPTIRKLDEFKHGAPAFVAPNGLHPERFPILSDEERQARRLALGITAPLVVGFQANFRAFHGIGRLRELMLAMSSRPDVHWLLIGDGPERRALQEAVEGRVSATFLGRCEPQEVGGLLALIDVAVAPHEFIDGIFYLSPLKIIEYAAAGCAIVASAQGDIPWLLDEGRAGVILNDPEIAAWARAVNDLLDDPQRRLALGDAARRHVLERFTWRHIAECYSRVLTSVVTPEPAAPAIARNGFLVGDWAAH